MNDKIKGFDLAQGTPDCGAALAALVAKLEAIHDHPRFKAVWETAHFRLGPYDGPTYTQELADARAALNGIAYASPDYIKDQIIHDLTDGISGTLQKDRIEALTDLLREARDKGLIYWEPQTTRGHVAKADMIARIDTALSLSSTTCGGGHDVV